MQIADWLKENTASLDGKTVAITGSTGGLGREICRDLAALGASLILLDRSPARSQALQEELQRDFPTVTVRRIPLDLEDIDTVKRAATALKAVPTDVLIHNAGAYSIPRHTCSTGLDNVFQINFASPYYLIRELLPSLRARGGKVVAVGSIAHTYSKTDSADIDFSTRKAASKVYGNAKRYLMFSLLELFQNEQSASLCIAHPGITLTNITAHYPKVIFALIKRPMKLIFMPPKKACLSVLRGIFDSCTPYEWIGPRVLNIWGYPAKKPLKTASLQERAAIAATAERLYTEMASKAQEESR